MGNSYAGALRDGLQLSKARRVIVADNNLSDKAGKEIVKGINKNVQEIDLS